MGWFNIFSRSKIDQDILDLYLEIELLIDEIDKSLQEYLSYLFSLDYYKSNPKDKKFHSIWKVYVFFKKLKEDYAYCYTLRKNKKHYVFGKNAKSRAEKLEIEIELTKIKTLLSEICSMTENLRKTNIKSNDFSELVKYVENFVETERILKKIEEKDEHLVYRIIVKIVEESETNAKENLWLLDQNDKKSKLFFSLNLSISEIKYLDLIPLLELKGLEKRSLFISELHKDGALPVYHYNLEINGRNIHVIPRNYKERIKPYLISA